MSTETTVPVNKFAAAPGEISPSSSVETNNSTSSTSSVKSVGKKVGNFFKSLVESPMDYEGLSLRSPVRYRVPPVSQHSGRFKVEQAL